MFGDLGGSRVGVVDAVEEHGVVHRLGGGEGLPGAVRRSSVRQVSTNSASAGLSLDGVDRSGTSGRQGWARRAPLVIVHQVDEAVFK